MGFNVRDIRAEAQNELLKSDYAEGLEQFRKLLVQNKKQYLEWRERKPFVQWTYDNIILSSQESSRAGNMRLSVYQREIGNNVFHNPECRQVSVLKGVQIGYSKGLRAIYGYSIAELAKRTSVTFPDHGDMGRFFKDELAKLHTECDVVRGLLRPAKRGEVADSMSEYRYSNGVTSYYRAAHNEDDLQGFTSWLQIADEADRSGWLPRGNSAGDKVGQLRDRGTDFHDCVSAWNKDPANGVIGVQTGPPSAMGLQQPPVSSEAFYLDACCGDNSEDTSAFPCAGQDDQGDLPGVGCIAESGAEGSAQR